LKAQYASVQQWWRELDLHSRHLIERMLGLPIRMPEDLPLHPT